MKLFDSYSNQLIDLNEELISIYNCGPTVYNHIHIGNARPLITMDVLHRFLKHQKKEVKYILNITDIDDKIINYALANNLKELEVSEFYFQAYLTVNQQLNILETIKPKVSDHMDQIIDYIDRLIKAGAGYFIEDDVYFDTSKIKNYGHLSKRDLDKDIAGLRIQQVEAKKSDNDFVLWKKTKQGITWNTPWGVGRPGWHSECSCLINHFIGEQVTIHGGGNDLKFPHHENENAQNNALYNKNLAKVWMHFGLVNINDEKMSKSLNNFVLVKDILNQFDYQTLRWFFYQTNYRQPIKYSIPIMEQNEQEIKKIATAIKNAKNALVFSNLFNQIQLVSYTPFNEALADDLDLVKGVLYINELIKKINTLAKQKEKANELLLALNQLLYCLDVYGIEFTNNHSEENIKLLKEWKAKVDANDYSSADQLRLELQQKGVL
ncbi:cysteine--tRNA ligase [Ureaplasma diversum]|uniref:Cysteine--tRNA ligase n=1 Tax=Ureaplasma diversum NCTC 246 TaxID=1188241 RepID=A0A084F140_9BACT|nr:cysteine--tRNA ligase [Ureaplasma diversum]KEZ23932.1 Cysteinyl-tRNA synthetase [Ureaplasma diversum NCTC 246]